jgi:hypothetical protein
MGQDKAYYAKIADACDKVRVETPASIADGRQLSPDAVPLPSVLAELHPNFLTISTNRIDIDIGPGRGGYGITWESVGPSSHTWELSTCAESLQKVVFTRVEP